MSTYIVILIGPPGCGKGTQAQIIAKKKGYKVIQTSKIIREKFNQQPQDPQVKKAKQEYQTGGLIPPETMAEWTIETLKKLDPEKQDGVIFDGSLRTVKETKVVLPFLIDRFGKENIKIFFLNISFSEVKRRLGTRLICEKCKDPVKPSLGLKVGDRCPKKNCPGKVIRREIDDPQIIEQRIDAYQQQTEPALKYLSKKGLVIEIDGEQSIAQVTKDITKHL